VSGWFYYKEIHKISTGGNTQQGSGACYCIDLIDSKTKIHEVMMSLHVKDCSVNAYTHILMGTEAEM